MTAYELSEAKNRTNKIIDTLRIELANDTGTVLMSNEALSGIIINMTESVRIIDNILKSVDVLSGVQNG